MFFRAIQQRIGSSGAWLPMTGLVLSLSLAGCASPPGGGVHVVDRNQRNEMPRVTTGHHVVRRGESLYSIAFRYGWDWRELAEFNSIAPPYTIYPGQKIRFSRAQPSSTYKVVSKPSPAPASSPSAATAPAKPAAQVRTPAVVPAPVPPAPAAGATRSASGWFWPASGPLVGRFSSNGSLNKGIDIGGQLGQPVLAASDGSVVYAGNGLRGYGELIIIKHSDLYVSAYGHNRRLLVREGQQVKAGQTIAEMGSTGTDQVKLHFEIRRQGKPVDPLQYLPSR